MKEDLIAVTRKQLRVEKLRLNRKRQRMRVRVIAVCIFILFLFYILFTKLLGIALVKGDSMYPSLRDGDFVLYSRDISLLETSDVILCHVNNEEIIKRIIAKPGETVDMNREDGSISVDRRLVSEPYSVDTGRYVVDMKFPLMVTEGRYFLLGDNRDDSLDSRNSKIGTVSKDDIYGKVIFVLRFGG